MPRPEFSTVFDQICRRHSAARVQRICGYSGRSTVSAIRRGQSSMHLDRFVTLSRRLASRGDRSLIEFVDITGPRRVVQPNGTLADERLLLEDIGAFGERAIRSGDERRIRRLAGQFEEAADQVRAEFSCALDRLASERRQRALL